MEKLLTESNNSWARKLLLPKGRLYVLSNQVENGEKWINPSKKKRQFENLGF